MMRSILTASVVMSVSLLTAQAQVGVLRLSLEQALDRAPEANFEILIGEERLIAQEQAQRSARGNLFPRVSAEAGQQRSQSLGNMADPLRQPAISNRFDAMLRASLSLFDVDNHAFYRVERFNTEIAQLTLQVTVQDILEAISRTYMIHQRNLRREATIEADIERDIALLELARNRYEAGAATEIDVTRAEVALATNQLRLAQQETVVEQSSLELKRALNMDLGLQLALDDQKLPPFETVQFSGSELIQILARRPETVSQARALERNEIARRAARLQRLPSVDLYGNYGYAGEKIDGDLDEVWSVGVGVSVPLFDGFRIEANQMQAASAVRQQEFVVQQVQAGVEAEYRLVLSQISSTRKQVDIATQQVSLAQRELELARIRFEEGVADNSEVVEAQAGLARASDGLIEAEYQLNLARLALARVRGDVRSVLYATR